MNNFSISDFIANVKSDGMAKQNRFWVKIGSIPRMYGEIGKLLSNGGGRKELEKIHMFCKSVNLNGIQIASTPIRLTGETIDVPYGRNFSPLSMIFYVDRQLIVRQFFEDWVSSIVDPNTRELAYYSEYCVDIEIYVLDKTESSSVYKVTLFDAHPKSIGNLMLDQENQQFMLLDVILDYRSYKTELVSFIPGQNREITGGRSALLNNFNNTLQTYNNDVISFQQVFTDPFNDYALTQEAMPTQNTQPNSLYGAVKARQL